MNTNPFRKLLLSLLFTASTAQASQAVTQWYFGNWTCLIDGRSAQMRWRVVDDPQITCQGDICTSTSGVAIRGWFKDGSGPWVSLDQPSNRGRDFRFHYTGDNTYWFLRAAPDLRSASGNTIWNGNPYPLSCRRP